MNVNLKGVGILSEAAEPVRREAAGQRRRAADETRRAGRRANPPDDGGDGQRAAGRLPIRGPRAHLPRGGRHLQLVHRGPAGRRTHRAPGNAPLRPARSTRPTSLQTEAAGRDTRSARSGAVQQRGRGPQGQVDQTPLIPTLSFDSLIISTDSLITHAACY